MNDVSRKIIFETEHLVVIEHDFGTETVFVTFNEMGISAKGTKYWGDAFFEKSRISAIGVMSKKPNWYPEDDMMRAIPAILETVRLRTH